MGGIINLVSKADKGQFKTIKQVSERVGRSPSQIKAAVRNGKVSGPTHKMPLGEGDTGAFVWLYTDKDIRRFQRYFRKTRPGRPRKEAA